MRTAWRAAWRAAPWWGNHGTQHTQPTAHAFSKAVDDAAESLGDVIETIVAAAGFATAALFIGTAHSKNPPSIYEFIPLYVWKEVVAQVLGFGRKANKTSVWDY